MFTIPFVVYDFEKENVKIGDVYKFTFTRTSKLYGLQKTFIKYFVERDGKFEVERTYFEDETGDFIVQAKVTANPLPFLAVFGIIIIGSSTLLYILGLQLKKVEKIVTVPAGEVLSYAALIGVIAIAYKTIF